MKKMDIKKSEDALQMSKIPKQVKDKLKPYVQKLIFSKIPLLFPYCFAILYYFFQSNASHVMG